MKNKKSINIKNIVDELLGSKKSDIGKSFLLPILSNFDNDDIESVEYSKSEVTSPTGVTVSIEVKEDNIKEAIENIQFVNPRRAHNKAKRR